jgi:hypothetical protein
MMLGEDRYASTLHVVDVGVEHVLHLRSVYSNRLSRRRSMEAGQSKAPSSGNIADFDGFYALYYHGHAGPGLAQIQLLEGKIIGADAVGGKWDGEFAVDVANGVIRCVITIKLPVGGVLATTGEAPRGTEATNMQLSLPTDFALRDFVQLELPIGKVNIRFQKLR